MIEPIVNSKPNSEQFTKQRVNSEHIPGLAELAIQQTIEQSKPKRFTLFTWRPFTKHQTVNSEQHKTERVNSEQPVNKTKQQVNSEQQTANKTEHASKLEVVNQTSRIPVEFSSLARLETGLQWVENLIHILTPRLLVVGFVLSMVDLLTHGSLLNIPYMMFAWAIVQAMAVDATLPNMWRLAWTRFDERRYVAGGILLAIGIGLGLVVFAALSIQFLQQAENSSLAQAMSKLGVNPELLTYVRSSSVVLLAAVLSVLNRTKRTAVSKPVNSEPMNSELTSEQRTSVSKRVNSEPGPIVNTKQSTEPLQFTSKQGVNSEPNKVLRLDESKQERIRTLLAENPDTTVTELAAAVGVSKGYASQQRTKFLWAQSRGHN